MKKILLYNPKAVFYDMPLALLSIGSCFDSREYQIEIIDGRLDSNPIQTLINKSKGAICLGVTCLTGAPVGDAFEVSKKFKEANPDIPIVWGGWHTSLFGSETLEECDFVDVTVQAQGEESFKEIVEAYVNKSNLGDIKGICFRQNGEVVKTPPRAMKNMDDLPAVNYDLINLEEYFLKKELRQLDYISSTGCFFRCTFCADPFVFNRKWSAISPERMISEISNLVRRFKITDVNFQDETYFTYPKRVKEIANGFINENLNISWAATMRADQGVRIPKEDWKTLADSGLRRVLIGVESGTQEMMDWLSKDIKIEQVWECAERCKEFGIGAIFPFIVGFPNESNESFEASLLMAKQLSSMSPKFQTPIFYFKPYPGSKITQEVVKEGYELPKSIMEWAEFDYIGSSGPWVSSDKYRKVERFKFYNKLANKKGNGFVNLAGTIAKRRLRKDFYSIPIEKKIFELLKKQPKLS